MTARVRSIPVLLLSGGGLTQTVRFSERRYIGEPVNAARIFSELSADELILLDIDARAAGRSISPELVSSIADEITMPMAAGGGIDSVAQVGDVISAGAEKVVLSTGACADPYLIKEASDEFGSSAIAVCIDVRRLEGGRYVVSTNGGKHDTGQPPEYLAQLVADHGAGELIVQSIDRDGTMDGYDHQLVSSLADLVTIPVVALGGAGTYADLRGVTERSNASAAAAGSLFVYRSKAKGVLINYPQKGELYPL